ncbi:hypothetical protein BUE80_DR009148 [Diplocarpon rosae]|nr:hypothetical protein BUE80_DR009148 [Diplocarpon rosae]
MKRRPYWAVWGPGDGPELDYEILGVTKRIFNSSTSTDEEKKIAPEPPWEEEKCAPQQLRKSSERKSPRSAVPGDNR